MLVVSMTIRLWAQQMSQIKNLTQWHDQEVGMENSLLFNGPVYLMQIRTQNTHQFFKERQWTSSDIHYENYSFYDVPVVFDIEKELIILKHPELYRLDGIVADMQRIVGFDIYGHHFKKIDIPESLGFYDILFEGRKLSLVLHHHKIEKAYSYGTDFYQIDKYYVIYNNTLNLIKKQKTIREILPNAYQILKKMRRNKVKLNPKNEQNLIKFIRTLDELI